MIADKNATDQIENVTVAVHEQCALRCFYNDECSMYNAENDNMGGFNCQLYRSSGAGCKKSQHSSLVINR